MPDVEKVKTSRSSARGSITKIKNYVNTNKDTLTLPDLECRLGILESYFQQLLAYQAQYEVLMPEDSANADYRSECEELYISAKVLLKNLIKRHNGSCTTATTTTTDNNQSIIVKSPSTNLQRIKLPTFSGKYSEYKNFIGIFNKTVGMNENYEDIEKCNILINSLSGLAKNAVKEFAITEENYPKILQQLKVRFDNKTLMFQELINELFDLPKISKPSASALRNLVDSVNAIFNSMLSIGDAMDIANSMIIHVVLKKLDPESQNKWEDSIDFTDLLKWKDCSKVLSKRCQYLECKESTQFKVSNHHGNNNSKSQKGNFTRNNVFVASSDTAKKCLICNKKDHNIHSCPDFKQLNVLDRFSKIKAMNLCINCLRKGHSVSKCSSISKCRVCSASHHTLLHRYNNSSLPATSATISNSPVASCSSENNTKITSTAYFSSNHSSKVKIQPTQVILATAVILVRDKFGEFKPARALLDSGSQVNFITNKLANSLGLKLHKIKSDVFGIGSSKTIIQNSTHIILKSRLGEYVTNLDALVLTNIAAEMPEPSIEILNWRIPQNIKLADPTFYTKGKIDLLIGADIFYDLLCIGQIKLGENLPSLQKTLLGWIVSGKYNTFNNKSSNNNSLIITNVSNETETFEEIHQLVKDFWKLECFENTQSILTQEQQLCKQFFENTVRFNLEGRILVKFPFKSNCQKLGSSRSIAERRFLNLEKKLQNNPSLKLQYTDFINEYIQLDHMELVPKLQEHRVKYYLPHHCVFKPDSTTTKVRVVFDGSCKTNTDISLNEVLMVGPVVQDDLFSILLRFRCFKYAVKADITKMYRQFLVDDPDTYYQCILWRNNQNEELKTYRLKTVTYGTASASYLSTASLAYLAKNFENKYPVGAKVIQGSFYVDDLLYGGDSLNELKLVRSEVNQILKSAGMELRKWYSNNIEMLAQIPESERETLINFNDSSILKTLGICWQPNSDSFQFTIDSNFFTQNKITKRVVLADMARLYDPLGLINPVIVKTKIFLQSLWILKLSWDESLPLSLDQEWKNIRSDIQNLNQFKIPRFLFGPERPSRIEIHGFSDASIKAYGGCVYIRSVDDDGAVKVSLLTAKSKIAPLQTQSIPRLELCAALLLTNLIDKVLKVLTIKVDEVFLWTDSEIVLDWLSAHPSTWVMFVGNRISKIQQLTENFKWLHVPTKMNPADILSRGTSVAELFQSNWFIGPEFLQSNNIVWPKQKLRNVEINELPEKRSSNLCSFLVQNQENYLYSVICKCSNFNKIIDIFAYILRFIRNRKPSNRQSTNSIILSVEERDIALLKIVEIIQNRYFHNEIRSLMKNEDINKKSILKNFTPFLEKENGIQLLKVGGRLRHANISESAKNPIFLPNNEHFVLLLIEYYHNKNLHAGPQALLAILRQRFWITNGKLAVSKVVRKCIRCFKFKPRLAQQLMGDLPKSRVDPCFPFFNTGVDFCGPVMVSYGVRGRQLYKAYIAVFVCFTTHSVHLELVSSLTADAFIASLKRFISRRGLCRNIYCDNATNFVGASHILEDLRNKFKDQQFTNHISKWCTYQGIDFHHIPARCPHFGGLWEAAVKSAKFHLKRCCFNLKITFEEMVTFLAQVEAILNSRPLTINSSDPNDESVLTPGHFLLGRPLNAISEPMCSKPNLDNPTLMKCFNRVTALQQRFWSRWSHEYLLNLQRRDKWTESSKNLVEGTIVLMKDDNVPPQHWSIAKIVKVYTPTDGHIRVVDVQRQGKVFNRHISTLAPLPIYE